MEFFINKQGYFSKRFYWFTEKEIEESELYIVECDKEDCEHSDFDFIDGKFVFNIEKYNLRKQELANQQRIAEIKQQLQKYTEDFVQVECGLIIPDIEQRRQHFAELLNEIRVLEGKSPRETVYKNNEN